MAKRNFRKSAADPFTTSSEETSKAPVDNSWLAADKGIFGDIAKADAQTERIKSYDIFSIVPDQTQPRRVIPSTVRQRWDGDPHAVPDLFVQWVRLVQAEIGREFTLSAYLLNEDGEAYRGGGYAPIERSLMELVDLAVSIRRDGLTHPITLVPAGNFHQIETGERRWLAYHLLHAFFDGQVSGIPNEQNKWRKIPARIMPERSVWRQAVENSARQNLNAIGKARQYAVLVMTLYAQMGDHFDPFNPAAPSDRHFYAQAARYDKTPYGRREELLSAMGFKSPAELTRCRKLLELPDEVWALADDHDLPQKALLRLSEKPPKEAVKIAQGMVYGQTDKPRISQRGRPPSSPALLTDPIINDGNRLFSKQKEQKVVQIVKELARMRDGVGQATDSTKSQIRQVADEIRRMLDDIEASL